MSRVTGQLFSGIPLTFCGAGGGCSLCWDWHRTWRPFFDHWHCHEGALVEDGGPWSWYHPKQLDVHFDKFLQFSKSSGEHCFFTREVLQKASTRQKWFFRNTPNFFWSNGAHSRSNAGHAPAATQTCQELAGASLHLMKMMSFLSGPRWKKETTLESHLTLAIGVSWNKRPSVDFSGHAIKHD